MKGRGRFVAAAMVLLVAAVFFWKVRLSIHGSWEGFFLLSGEGGDWAELSDDLFLGEGARLVVGIDFAALSGDGPPSTEVPRLEFRWNEADGGGFVRNILPGGRVLFTSLGRFTEDEGRRVRGLLVGGGLPSSAAAKEDIGQNETGMAYFDGTRWFHIWCNVNEALSSTTSWEEQNSPGKWRFLGSKVLNRSATRLSMTSRHEATIDNVPVQIDRFIHFRAGDPYFRLSVRIMNPSGRPIRYYYAYSDEPWLGNFGSSEGNIGWTADGYVAVEQRIDTRAHSFIGMADVGSPFLPPKKFTGMANFIEWLGPDLPDTAYFSNSPDQSPHPGTPLTSNERTVAVQWGPRTLQPLDTHVYYLVVGMATIDPATGKPVKPEVHLRAPLPGEMWRTRRLRVGTVFKRENPA